MTSQAASTFIRLHSPRFWLNKHRFVPSQEKVLHPLEITHLDTFEPHQKIGLPIPIGIHFQTRLIDKHAPHAGIDKS